MSILMQILWTTQLIFTSVASTVASNLHTFINQTVHSGELEFYWSFEVVHTTCISTYFDIYFDVYYLDYLLV